MKIQVLGPGCPTCKKLLELTKEALKQMNCVDEVEYITDVSKIVEMGVMGSPVLAINGRPVMVGFLPDVERIKELISRANNPVSAGSSGCSCGGNC
jgi:small redox-active disulfide protein 2